MAAPGNDNARPGGGSGVRERVRTMMPSPESLATTLGVNAVARDDNNRLGNHAITGHVPPCLRLSGSPSIFFDEAAS